MAFPDSFQRTITSIPKTRRLLLGLGAQTLIPFVSLYVALLLRLLYSPLSLSKEELFWGKSNFLFLSHFER